MFPRNGIHEQTALTQNGHLCVHWFGCCICAVCIHKNISSDAISGHLLLSLDANILEVTFSDESGSEYKFG